MKLSIGIDPGLSGGVAFVPESGTPWAHKMPETDRDLIDLLRDSINLFEPTALIELVHSSPQMGVKSAFTFGEGYGRIQMALTALGVPYERVRPQAWQKAMGCLTKGDKNVSKRKAQELFPALKVTHAIADALLIAEYGRRARQ
jgi:Holliday junction resolvasome RuvABC endonuclease subunit